MQRHILRVLLKMQRETAGSELLFWLPAGRAECTLGPRVSLFLPAIAALTMPLANELHVAPVAHVFVPAGINECCGLGDVGAQVVAIQVE